VAESRTLRLGMESLFTVKRGSMNVSMYHEVVLRSSDYLIVRWLRPRPLGPDTPFAIVSSNDAGKLLLYSVPK
jgi:hypothetical protein